MSRSLTSRVLAVIMLAAPSGAGAADAPSAAAGAVVKWYAYEEGLAVAQETGRPILLNFTADWCKFCRKMKAETYADPQVAAALNAGFVPVMIDTEKDPRRAAEYFVRGLPTIWFVESNGKTRITNLPGYVDAPTFLQILRYISTRGFETMDFKTFMDKGA